MLNEKLEVTDHELRLMAIKNNKDRPQLGVNTAFAEGFKIALAEVKKLDKTCVTRSIICYFFGHSFKLKSTEGVIRIGCCDRCNKKMYGAEMKGELTGVVRWIYVTGDINK